MAKCSSLLPIRVCTTCSMPRPANPLIRQQDKAYMFSSPTVVGDVVLLGVLNGTLVARDTNSGNVLWEYQTETSKKNKGWILTSDRNSTGHLFPLALARYADCGGRSAIQYRRRFFDAARRERRGVFREHGWMSLRSRIGQIPEALFVRRGIRRQGKALQLPRTV